ncbi:17231_t:CDS:2 [Funneliformis caledonium]|uniref:17231_t:CDS:1 n=1 Tax=Funneliformis caledonium TaxID=1117310 RepID=A0A9N9A1F3_9GLOM|nr:17231_t:CDS:2 [Funneliformis caledonium]
MILGSGSQIFVNESVLRRITRSLANSSQQANQEIGENVPDHLRYFYRSRQINMSNAIENTIDDYEAMDIDEPEQMEISSEIMSRDNADTESNIMSIDQPLDVELNSDGIEIEHDIHYDGEENDSDTDEIHESTHDNEPQIIQPNSFLPSDIKDVIKSVSRTECNSEQLARLANFFLLLERPMFSNWNLDLLVQKLLDVVQKTTNNDSMPSIEALMLQQFEPEILRQLLERDVFQGTGNDPNVITMASRCLGNLVMTLGDNSERMIGRAIREDAIPLLCNILTEGPRTYDSEHLKDIILALYNFSKPTFIDCTESIVKKNVFKNIMESIMPFLIDEDRVLPLKLLANCTCKVPHRYIKQLLVEVFNTVDFQAFFADHEMPEVTKWCCISLCSLISRYRGDVESLLVFSNPDVIKNITYRMKQFDEYNQLRIWKMFNTLINKSRRITNLLIDNGVVKALFDVLSRKSINNPEKDQNENELIGEIVTEVNTKLRYRYVNMEPIKLYMQVCHFILSLFPAVPDPGMLHLMVPDGKISHKWTSKVDWLTELVHNIDANHDEMKVDCGNTSQQPILNKQEKLFAVIILPSLFKSYRASECWELRKLIMMSVLAFVVYYPEDLICKIFEYSHIEEFLSNIFFTNAKVKQKSEEEDKEEKDDVCIRDVRAYAEDLLIQIILKWNSTFQEAFDKKCIYDEYTKILEKYQQEFNNFSNIKLENGDPTISK